MGAACLLTGLFYSPLFLVAVAAVRMVAASGGELSGRERNSAEHLARILSTAGIITAFLGWHGVFHHRNYQLGIPFQTDDGKLPKGNEQTAAVTGQDQLLLKHTADALGNLNRVGAAAVADFFDPGAEHHRIQYLHHSSGTIGTGQSQTVRFSQAGITAEDMSVAILTAKYSSFCEYRQPIQSGRTGSTYSCIC